MNFANSLIRLAPFDTPFYMLAGLFWWTVFSPLVLTLTCCGSLARLSITLIARYFRPDLISISYKDAFFAALYACDQKPLMSVGTTMKCQGRVDTEQLMNRFQECFLTGEENLKRYGNLLCNFQLYYGYVFKHRVQEFSLKNHFLEHTLPRGGEAEEYIQKWLVTNTYYTSSKEGQPCWQVLILRKQQTEKTGEETIISIKMHHGMIDGYSIVHMIDKLTGTKSPYIVTKPKKESLLTKLKHLLSGPGLAFDVFVRLRPWKDQLSDQGDPFQPEWVMSLTTLDTLQMVKDIRKKTNAKFATIMMSAITGALKRMYLTDKNVPPEKLPEKIWMEAPIALPNHPSMTKGGKFCNHFTAGIYGTSLKTNDAVHRLNQLERDFHSFEAHSGMEVMLWVVYVGYLFQPAWLVRNFYTNCLTYLWRFSVLYSGLIANPKKIKLLGHTIDNIYFLQATATAFPFVSLFVMCSTYNGKMDVSCYAGKNLAKNKAELERLIQVHLKTELEELHARYYNPDGQGKKSTDFIVDLCNNTISPQ